MVITSKNKIDSQIKESNMLRVGFFMELIKLLTFTEHGKKEAEELFKLRNYEINEFIEFVLGDYTFKPSSSLNEADNSDFHAIAKNVVENIGHYRKEFMSFRYSKKESKNLV